MSINAFLFFPEDSEEIFLDQSKFESFANQMQKFILELKKTKNSKEYKEDIKIYFDSENIESFISKASVLIDKEYLENPKNQLRIILQNESNIKNSSQIKSNENNKYIIVDDNNNPPLYNSHVVISEIAERIYLSNQQNKYILINFGHRFVQSRKFIPVFKDNLYNPDLPEKFVKIYEISYDYNVWLSQYKKFTIMDDTKFKPSPYQNGAAREEISTGLIWYLDTLHKNHFEIFNSDKKGYGIANLDGEIDTTSDKAKKVQKRRLDDK